MVNSRVLLVHNFFNIIGWQDTLAPKLFRQLQENQL